MSTMKALMISGSPRKDGNTVAMLSRCLKTLTDNGIEGELVSLGGKTIHPCTACGSCRQRQDKRCVIAKDDFHAVFDKMLAADIIVVGSPVYFGSATPELMALLDRAGYVSRGNGNLFSRKLGGPVAVARRAGQNFTYAQLLYWYMINNMVVPGSSYWNIGFGAAAGEVEQGDEAMGTIETFAENLAWLAGKIEG